MPTLNRLNARERDNAGIRNRRIETYTGPASYATGGDSITPGDVGLGTIELLPDFHITDGSSVRTGVYNYTTQRVLFFVPNTNVQVANGVDLSTFSGRFEVIGM